MADKDATRSDKGAEAEIIDLDKARKAAAARLRQSKDEETELVKRMNRDFALVPYGDDCFVYRELPDPLRAGRFRLNRFTDRGFRKLLLNRRMTVERPDPRHPGLTKSVVKTHADIWLEHPLRRQCLGGEIFDPTGRADPRYYWLLYKGLGVKPIKNRQGWSLMQEHIYHVLAAGNRDIENYILNYAALMLQHPDRHPEVSLIFRTDDEGAGKGIFVQALIKILGQHALHLHHTNHVGGRFNAHLYQLILLYIDEAHYAGDRQLEGYLKGIVADPEIAIEPKNKDMFSVKNYLHIIMSSNRDWVIPASKGSRRWAVIEPSAHRKGDRRYFDSLGHEMNNGGIEAMAWDLLHRPVGHFDPRLVPLTAALQEQRLLSLDILDRWLIAVLDRGFLYRSRFGAPSLGEWHEFHTTQLLNTSHNQFCKDIGWHHPATDQQLAKFMRSIGYTWHEKRNQPIGELDYLRPPSSAHPSDTRQPDLPIEKPVEGPDIDAPTPVVTDWRDGAVIRQPRPTGGYQMGSLDEARAKFQAATDDLPMPWRRPTD
jgi:hypothetical protein